MRSTPARLRYAVAPLTCAAVLAGCGGSAPAPVTTPPASTTPTSSVPVETPTPSPTATCAQMTFEALSPDQRLGQLLMVGFDTNAALSSLDASIGTHHVGNVIYLGGWDGAQKVTSTSEHLQGLVGQESTGGVRLIIAADQEGGIVHQLRGVGFTQPPSASQQAQLAPEELTRQATGWAKEIKAAGVNVNLAPVTDTVPAEIGKANEPIGKWGRQYGSTPRTVTRAATAFLKGMLAGGVEGTVKHFPGLGRIRSNTDFNATGITDSVATVDDPFLEPFRAGIEAGAGLVMVSSARYPKLDAKNPAMFSSTIIDGLLRDRLGFEGVVITDDVNAAAVKSVPAPERAVRLIAAGGDIVLTGDASVAPAMIGALRAKAAADPEFAEQVDTSVKRVLALKERMALLPCSG